MLPALTNSIRSKSHESTSVCPEMKANFHHDEKQLRELWHQLNTKDRATLLRFAAFLASSQAEPQDTMTVFPQPESFPRPAEESVVKAIKRLTATYPMINKDKLLHQTSDLMAEHVIQGRAAAGVIDDLEVMFAEHYQQLKNEFEQNC